MKKFLLILILFTLTGAVFAQNNGKLPTINTSSSKTAPKSKMPTINAAPAEKPAPQTAKPVQKPVEKPAPVANSTETKAAPTEETVDSAPAEQPAEAPSLLKAAEAHKDNGEVEHKVLDGNEFETAEPQPSGPATSVETDTTTPTKPVEVDGHNVPPAVAPDDSTAAPANSTNETEQE